MVLCTTTNLNWTKRKRKWLGSQWHEQLVLLSYQETTKVNQFCFVFFFFFLFLETEIPAVLFLKTLNPLIWVKEIKTEQWCQSRDKTQHLFFPAPFWQVRVISYKCYSQILIINIFPASFWQQEEGKRTIITKQLLPFHLNYSSAWNDTILSKGFGKKI